MKSYFVTILSLSLELLSAQNLVFNPSFELKSNCPKNFGEAYYSIGWHTPQLQYSTPDYYNSCDTSILFGVPVNNNGYNFQVARTGDAYIGILCIQSFPDNREYIYSELLKPLDSTQEYYTSFHIVLADPCQIGVSTIGAFFSITDSFSTIGNMIDAIPSIESPITEKLSDTVNWKKIYGKYTAKGGEKFITIGNFRDDASSGKFYTNHGVTSASYYFIDDVCVSLNPADCGIDTSKVNITNISKPRVSFSLFPNPAKDRLTLMYQIGDNQNLNIEVTNTLGQVVEQNISLSEWGLHELNTSNLQRGIYFLKVSRNRRLVNAYWFVIE